MAVRQAKILGLNNFSVLVSHVMVPPAMRAILSGQQNRVQGFLAAGHVCAVMGYHQYHPLAQEFHVPIVVTGFEPLDLLDGVLCCVRMLEAGEVGVQNQYTRIVREQGNLAAQSLIQEVFEITDRSWRGIGEIPSSGLRLTQDYADFDAERRFPSYGPPRVRASVCISGEILQGLKKPAACPAFWDRMHAGTPAWRYHGLIGRRMRSALQLWPMSPARSRTGNA
jgi:hydrogenase expression/formation protein HypD